jgi:precorrin-4 methylase
MRGVVDEMSSIAKQSKRALSAIVVVLLLFGVYAHVQAQSGQSGDLYLVGMGPGAPDLATVRALKVVEKADLVFCHSGTKERFSAKLGKKEVITPPQGVQIWHEYGKSEADFKAGEELDKFKASEKARSEITAKAKSALKNGKTVTFLDDGDPLIYGLWGWILEELEEFNPVVVPGLSSFNAANAALKKGPTSGSRTKSVILTMPDLDYMAREDSVEELAKHQATMVIFMPTVSGHTLEGHVETLLKHYPPDTPIALVAFAGYKGKEKVLVGTLDNIVSKVTDEDKTFLHLIYVGDFLTHDNKATR